MAANDYTRTVNITPLGTSYSWDTPPSWITITRQGSSNDWTITVAANSGAPRSATLTVRHDNTSTVDTIEVTQAGIINPTATPIAPTATAIVPTATPAPTSSYTLSFDDSSFLINDFANGAGSYVDLVYTITGTTSAPILVEKDNRISFQNLSGPTGNRGAIRVTSLLPASEDPVSYELSPDLRISHPLDSSVVATISGGLTEAEGGGRFEFENSPTATPAPNPTSTASSSGGCLVAGTKITLADNSLVNVEDLISGTELFSTVFGDIPNTDNSGILKAWTSESPMISSTSTYLNSITSYLVDKVYNINNGLIISSKDHLHIVKRDNLWTVREARELVIGDTLMSTTGEIIISNIDVINEYTTVYNLNVEPNDTYIANGIVTHNKGVGGGGSGCHIAGEMITLANGETKAVENINVGDQLLSLNIHGYNFDENAYKNWSSHIDNLSGELATVEVINIKVDTYTSYYNFNEGALKITYEHPILIKDTNDIVSWKIAKDAMIGESMLSQDNQWILIDTKLLVETETPFTTWTLDVETEDVYFANGILVHNSAPEELTKDPGDIRTT